MKYLFIIKMVAVILHILKGLPLKRFYLITLLLFFGYGCANLSKTQEFDVIAHKNLPIPDITLSIPGLSNCTDIRDIDLKLNSKEPVTIIVHGCYSSAANYKALAKVFAFHGQQTVCFNYDYRDSMMDSASQMIQTIKKLSFHMQNKNMTIVAHSQGGLIARKACVKERHDTLEQTIKDMKLRLVTISSPFAGIKSAAHCGSKFYLFLTLGLQIPICKMIAGNKWDEIPSASEYIRKPGYLIPEVKDFYQIVTDEIDTCRRWGKNGKCIEDDYVFSLKEQYYHKIDISPGVEYIEVKSGHTEIVGNDTQSPVKLIGIFQDIGILAKTPPEKLAMFKKLLRHLY